MERCDFSSVMTIVRRFISDDYNTNQTELLGDVFSSFFNPVSYTHLDVYKRQIQISSLLPGKVGCQQPIPFLGKS